jgi:hypothetical protein
MKKVGVSIILFISTFSVCLSQLQIGASYGIFQSRVSTSNYQKIHDTAQSKFVGKPSNSIKITSYLRLNASFSLRPELQFINTNFNETLDTGYHEINQPPGWYDVHNYNYEYNLKHLRLPVLINYSIPVATFFKFQNESKKPLKLAIDVFGGPFFSYVVSFKRTYTHTHNRNSDNLPNDPKYNFTRFEEGEDDLKKEAIKRWDYGLTLGLGIRIDISQKFKLFFDVRNSYTERGLNDGLWNRTARRSSSPFEIFTISPKIRLEPLSTFSLGLLYNLVNREE